MMHTKTYLVACLVACFLLTSQTAQGLPTVNNQYVLYPGIGFLKANETRMYDWAQAFKQCSDEGAHLAVPNSEEEATVYQEIIATFSVLYQDTVFIGYHDQFVNGEYETVLDTPLAANGYTKWASGEPNVSPDLRCGGFSKDGGLVNLPCDIISSSIVICEKPLWSAYEKVTSVGWYKLHTSAATWTDAWRTCREEGAHLAVINNTAEYAELQRLLTRDRHQIADADAVAYAWLGVHAAFTAGDFRTVVGSSLNESGYSSWERGYPEEHAASRPYVALQYNNGSLTLPPASWKLAFFCEHEL